MQSNTLTSDKTSSDESKRLAIARQMPSTEIIKFANANNVNISQSPFDEGKKMKLFTNKLLGEL